jgi:hypothetical protein
MADVRAAVRRLSDAEKTMAVAAVVLADLLRAAPADPKAIATARQQIAERQRDLEEAAGAAREAAKAAGDMKLIQLINRTPGLKRGA